MAAKEVNGTDLQLKVNGVAIGCATGTTFSSSYDMVDSSCKQTGKFRSQKPGGFSASLSIEGFVFYDTPADATQMREWNLAALHLNQTLIEWEFSDDVTGHYVWAGSGYINSYELGAPDKETATYNIEIQVDGEYTHTAIV